jgi:hypothetical protein
MKSAAMRRAQRVPRLAQQKSPRFPPLLTPPRISCKILRLPESLRHIEGKAWTFSNLKDEINRSFFNRIPLRLAANLPQIVLFDESSEHGVPG